MQRNMVLGGSSSGEVVGRLLWDLFRDTLKVFSLCGHLGDKPRLLLRELMIQSESSEASKGPPPHAVQLAAAVLCKGGPFSSMYSHTEKILPSLFSHNVQSFVLFFLLLRQGLAVYFSPKSSSSCLKPSHARIIGMPLKDWLTFLFFLFKMNERQ